MASFAAEFERSEIFIQWPSGTSGRDSIHRRSWFRSSRLILRSRMRSIRWSRTACGSCDQPAICGIYSPNTKRPSCSPSSCASSASCEERKRWANAKNSFSFRWRASIPSSISSTSTRLSLSLLRRAMLATFLAVGSGRVRLRRTCFLVFTPPVYTNVVQENQPIELGISCPSVPSPPPSPRTLSPPHTPRPHGARCPSLDRWSARAQCAWPSFRCRRRR